MPDLGAYRNDHPDRERLRDLHKEMTSRRMTVERFARVASPARGTTLASRRLDAWASMLLNVLKLIPVMRETGAAELIRKCVLALLQERTDPRVMPGVEAMMPQSACVRMLNTAEPRAVSDGLASLTGDTDGRSIISRPLMRIVDLFYGGANDLVVDTSSMTLGLGRPDERVARFKGADINHVSYFSNQPSREALRRWLTGDGPDVPDFFPVDHDPSRGDEPGGGARGGPSAAPPPVDATVLLVPEAFGCVITDGAGRTLWPDVRTLAADGPDAVLVDRGGRRPADLVAAYNGFLVGLEAAGTVRPVPWDVCRPLDDAARAFLTALADTTGHTHVVAHGAGALVVERARDLPAADGRPSGVDLWTSMQDRGGRCVYLSPPLAGSWAAEATLRGEDALTLLLQMVHPASTVAAITGRLEHLEAITAQRPAPTRASPPATRWTGVVAVYGAATETAAGESGAPTAALRTSSAGDGSVLFPGTELPGLRKRYATVGIWDLVTRPALAAALATLLTSQDTPPLLTSAPPATAEVTGWRSVAERLLFPTSDDLTRAALHGATVVRPLRPRLRVSVLHGDMKYVDDPVILGSFDGTPIAGAERTLDAKLRGALTRRQQLGQHAGPTGTFGTFSRSDGGPAAVVIGIGDPGDITPGRLSAGVTQAVLRLVAADLDARGGEAEALDIATVFIGTGGTSGMTIAASVTAIINGIRRANRRLRGLSGFGTVASVQFVELYEERAADAAHALRSLPTGAGAADPADPTGDVLVVETVVQTGRDGRRGQPRREDRDDEWRTVRVNAVDTGSPVADGLAALSFTSIGSGAGAGQQISATQRKLIDRLVLDAIGDPRVDKQLYNTLYELLLPPAMKGTARERDNIMYVVDEHAAALPLELLGTRSYDGTIQPIAVDVGVVRRLETRNLRSTVRVASGRAALVVGNPPSKLYPQLPGAAREAHEVAEALRENGFRVTELIADDADDPTVTAPAIMNALFDREYRVVHIAAHGVYDEHRPAASGVVIGDGLYLTALEIQRMRAVPEIIFLNCCHSAGGLAPTVLTAVPTDNGDTRVTESLSGWRPDRTAASISRALIDSGVRAVVAAGWAVDDRAATGFAAELYRLLLGGVDLGHAAQQARKHTHDRFSDVNTWGAYQVYGPPAYRLGTATGTGSDARMPVSRREFRDALDKLKNGDDPEATRRRLHQLLDAADGQWHGDAEYELIGEVHTKLGDYPAAIEAYQKAVAGWPGKVRIHAAEQLANLEVKLAIVAWRQPQAPVAAGVDPEDLFTKAQRRLKGLIDVLGDTPERLSLLGSYSRRRALVSSTLEKRREAIRESVDAYRRAADQQSAAQVAPDLYHEINYIAMRALAERHGLPVEDLERPSAALPTGPATVGNFWARVAHADANLAVRLREGALTADAADDVVDRYEEVFASGSSPGDRLTVTEHLDILADLMPPDHKHEAEVLRAGSRRLEAWSPVS
jgi:CHAT domain-containing protein